MPTEIDALSISIETKAQKANSSIDKLVSRLDVLSNSLGKLHNGSNNLVALGRGVESLSRGMQGFKGVGEAKFIRLANGINQLANINTQGLNNAASSLSHMTRAFNNIGAVSQNAVQVSDLAKNLGKLGNKSVTNAITNIPQLATAMNNLMTTLSKAPKVSENVIRMTNALANLSAQGAKVGSASNSIVRGLNRASNSATRATSSFGGLASVIGKFYATYFLFFRAFRGLWKSINMTADYVEAFNYYTVSFGKIASKWDADWENYADDNARNYANRFVTTLNKTFSKLSGVSYNPQTGLLSETGLENLGLNLQEVTQYAAQLSSMMDAVGQSGEVTLATTNAFVKLAGDISSLYNIDYQDAADKIRSVLQGQSRAGYGFGWDTTAAALQETASNLGISKAVSEMAQWEKQQLRILTILEQSKVAYGDQSNTINTLANQIRLFKNNIKEAGMLLGQLFVPILTKLMPIINGVTIAIKRLLSSIAGLLGIEIKDVGQGFSGIEEDIDGIGDSFDDATASAKKFKTYTLGIDELNIQPEQAESGGSGAGGVGGGIDLTDEILEATSEYEKVWQKAFDEMQNRAQEFADKIEKIFEPITKPLKRLFNEIKLGGWTQAGMYAGDIVVGIFDTMSSALNSVDWDEIGRSIGLFFKGINWTEVLSSVGNFIETLWDSAFELWKGSFKIAPMGTLISSLLAGYFAINGISIVPKLIIAGVTWVIGFDIGKEIGKKLFPEDAAFYDNFTWFEEGGFFDTVFGDINSVGDAIKRMGQAWTAVNNAIMESPVLSTLQFILNPVNWTIRFAIYNAQGFDFEELKSNLTSIFNDVRDIGNSFESLPFIEALTGFANSSYIEDIIVSIDTLKSKLETWFTEDVQPWFTEEKWLETIDGIRTAFAEKWEEVKSDFEETGLGKFLTEDVFPLFNKKVWNNALKDIPTVFRDTFKNAANMVSTQLNRLLDGIEKTFNGALEASSKFSNENKLLASALGFALPTVAVNPIKLDRIPMYAKGGFPEDGLFMANHNELVGQFSNGRTAVANNEQIVAGIEYGVERAVERALAPYLSDIARNTRETADKDMSVNIGDRDIARANARGSKSLGYALIY